MLVLVQGLKKDGRETGKIVSLKVVQELVGLVQAPVVNILVF